MYVHVSLSCELLTFVSELSGRTFPFRSRRASWILSTYMYIIISMCSVHACEHRYMHVTHFNADMMHSTVWVLFQEGFYGAVLAKWVEQLDGCGQNGDYSLSNQLSLETIPQFLYFPIPQILYIRHVLGVAGNHGNTTRSQHALPTYHIPTCVSLTTPPSTSRYRLVAFSRSGTAMAT